MDFEATRDYLLSKPETLQDYPFGPDVAVFKIRNKMFATLAEDNGVAYTNLKCDPDEALALRDLFAAVNPGYHMNKKHWNTLTLDGSIPGSEIQRMIDNSYTLVLKGLPVKVRQSLEITYGRSAIYGVE